MSKITKLLVMLLALVMVVSLFAGCKPAEQTDPTKQPQASGNNQTTASSTIENDMFPLEEPITFKMAVRGEKEFQVLMEKCEWYKYLCEKTNVFIECVVLGSDYVGRLNTLIATGSAPDVVLGPITLSSPQVIDLAAQDKLIPLDDYVTDASIMPNYQRLLEAVPEALNKMKAPDGHIWSIAGIFGTPGTVWESPLSVNIEWLKKVPGYEDGKTFPKDVEAFTEVLRYFKEHDMNGNGDPDDEVPMMMVSSSNAPADAQGTLQGLMNLWGIGTKDGSNEYYVHISDDGEDVTIAPTTQNYRDCLKWVNVWYEEGLLWDNFFAKVSSKDFAAVHGNEVPMWGFFNGANWYNNGPDVDNLSQPWGDAQTLVIPFDTGYDVHYFLNPALYGNLNNFTIFNVCEEPEILLAWYDQFMSLEGTLCAYNRMPNEWERWDDAEDYRAYFEANPTWYIDEDGTYVHPQYTQEGYISLKEFNVELNDKMGENHPNWSSIFNSNAVFKGVTPDEYSTGMYPGHKDSETIMLGKWIEEHPEYFDYNIWPRPYSTEEEAEELATYWPSVYRVIQDWEVQFIKGEKSLDDDWDDFQQELLDAGSQELIDTLAAMWERVKE